LLKYTLYILAVTAKVVKIYKLSVLSGFNKTKITDSELSFLGKAYKLFACGLLTRAF
jgi:hypothetical protein